MTALTRRLRSLWTNASLCFSPAHIKALRILLIPFRDIIPTQSAMIDDAILYQVEEFFRTGSARFSADGNIAVDNLTNKILDQYGDLSDPCHHLAYMITTIMHFSRNYPDLFINSKLTYDAYIGKDSYGTVHESLWHREAVAVKLLHRSFLEKTYNSQNLDEFFERLEAWKQLYPHRNIMPFHGCYAAVNFDTQDIELALVFPLADGGNLKGYPETGKHRRRFTVWWDKLVLLPIHVLTIIVQMQGIAQGLQHLHANRPPIVHGHLSSENILITAGSKRVLRLGDFGLSYIVGLNVNRIKETDFTGSNVTDDIFSFGALIYELMTGISQPSSLHRRPDELQGKDWDNIWGLLQECLSDQSKQRPSSARVVNRLNSFQT
ncbi:hypothetical protein D9758_017981 [Tetrapyrgos nigripes]|uniref:Protein kinase domain-containing protein n=1 Tax=Tetrapyrgos nigripes TaxID=182062 RepID=A0A8H5C2S1_9AGAR|nr:hypothetical protein D9758_017981 [Tetrapyrgos nigripes]